MKTSRLLKFTLSIAILAFISGNVFGQENASWINMTADQNTTDSVVAGATLPYYVEPDDVINDLSGQYDPSTDMSDQGINSTFSWTQEDETGSSITFNDPSADGADAPYQTVEFPGTAVDDIEIGVTEVAPGAGGCEGTLQTVTVDVIDEPSFTVNDGSKDLEVCAGATDDIQIVSIGGDQIDGTSSYKFLADISKEMEESDGSMTSVGGDYPHTDSVINVSTTDGSDINVLEGYTFTCGNDGTDDRVTEYTFDFSSGINHHISRKSDYLDFNTTGELNNDDRGKERPSSDTEETEADLYSWYTPSDGSSNTITVTVYPTPETGNIHYVPNDFEQ